MYFVDVELNVRRRGPLPLQRRTASALPHHISVLVTETKYICPSNSKKEGYFNSSKISTLNKNIMNVVECESVWYIYVCVCLVCVYVCGWMCKENEIYRSVSSSSFISSNLLNLLNPIVV
jgi:putative lipase involved disintegration of autophagic bodies